MQHHQPIQNNTEIFNAEKGKYTDNGLTLFPKAESFSPHNLYPSKISKVPDHNIYILRKFRKYQTRRFIPFEKFESTKLQDL